MSNNELGLSFMESLRDKQDDKLVISIFILISIMAYEDVHLRLTDNINSCLDLARGKNIVRRQHDAGGAT